MSNWNGLFTIDIESIHDTYVLVPVVGSLIPTSTIRVIRNSIYFVLLSPSYTKGSDQPRLGTVDMLKDTPDMANFGESMLDVTTWPQHYV